MKRLCVCTSRQRACIGCLDTKEEPVYRDECSWENGVGHGGFDVCELDPV
jgi:hypothetical protein